MTDDLTETLEDASEPELTAADVLGAQHYKVCGVVLEASFTFDELSAWRDFAKTKGVSALEAKLAKAGAGAVNDLRTKSAYETQEKLVNALVRSIDNKLKKLEDDPEAWGDEDGATLERMSERLDRERVKLARLDADPEKVLATTESHMEVINELQFERRVICLEFVHKLATERGQTKEKFPTWRKRAKGQDLVNAQQVVRSGNAAWSGNAKASRHYQSRPAKQLN